MLQNTETISPSYVISIISRRRWWILLPIIASLIFGIYLAIALPKKYLAETLILIEPQSVPNNYVRSLVSTNIDARISTISQQIMSRTNLEKIIKQFNLFADEKYKDIYLEDKLERLRKRISVKVIRSRHSTGAFRISYKGPDPQKVMRITNQLASFFINANLKVREQQAIGTSNFLENELDSMRQELERQERRLKEYRQKYMGELPEQLDTNLRILDRMQKELSDKQESLRSARGRKMVLQQAIDELRRGPVKTTKEDGGDVTTIEEPGADEIRLAEMKQQLNNMLDRYTEKHPDVQRLMAAIKRLEDNIKKSYAVQSENGKSEDDSMKLAMQGGTSRLRRLKDMMVALRGINVEIAKLEQEIGEIQRQIQIYQKRVERTPQREQELLSLQRDYQNIKTTYDSLLKRKLEAEIAVNMEKRQQGEQFRILDPARLPEKPVEPNMKKIFVMILFAGISIGVGLAALQEYLDNSFHRIEDVEKVLDLQVIGAVPRVYHPFMSFLHKMETALSYVAAFLALVLLTGFATLSLKGVDQTLAIIKQYISL